MTDKTAEPLLPVELGPGKVKFAQGIKSGRWAFATGVMAQDFKNGIAPDVLSERAPHAGLPKPSLLDEGQQWAGQQIKLEPEFIIPQRLVPSLALSGATIDDIIDPQVYLTEREAYSAFNETLCRSFAKTRPPLSIIPCME